MPEYDKANHPDPPWKWVPRKPKDPAKGDDGGVEGDYWELRNSANSSYNCTTYTVDKAQAKAPDGNFVKEKDAIDDLTNLGYQKTDGSKCGCGEGKMTNCMVIYRGKDGNVFHAAALDPKLCDWGGKLTGAKPIIRFQKPEDYLLRFGKEERKDSEMIFYCKKDASPYISDPDMAKQAKK